jgi:hypothetical protein
MSLRHVSVALPISACLIAPSVAAAQTRCVAGELVLPADETGATGSLDVVAADRQACVVRVESTDDVSGLIVFRATPKGTPEIADAPHPRLMVEMAQGLLRERDLRIKEPKWRRLDVPFSGFDGFGNGTMFGFDGLDAAGQPIADIVFLVFDGPEFHYDVTLVSAPEATHPDVWKVNIDRYRQVLAGLNKVKGAAPGGA